VARTSGLARSGNAICGEATSCGRTWTIFDWPGTCRRRRRCLRSEHRAACAV